MTGAKTSSILQARFDDRASFSKKQKRYGLCFDLARIYQKQSDDGQIMVIRRTWKNPHVVVSHDPFHHQQEAMKDLGQEISDKASISLILQN